WRGPLQGAVRRHRHVLGRGRAARGVRGSGRAVPRAGKGRHHVKVEVHNRCSDFSSYRAARVKSLFNAESGCNFDLVAELPIDDPDWKVGLVVGPSGSGKTSIGRRLFGPDALYEPGGWPADKPIVDAIAPGGSFDDVTAA